MKPILIGMNDPRKPEGSEPLNASIVGRAGGRLVACAQDVDPAFTAKEYHRGLIRLNLCDADWSGDAARHSAAAVKELIEGVPGPVESVILGREAWQAFGFPLDHERVYPLIQAGNVWRWLPHPSGRNHWYNDEGNRRIAGLLVLELVRGRQYVT